MLNFISTQNNTFIIGWLAKLLGYIMNYLYLFFNHFMNIENIGLCIIIFTLIIKLLMIPLTIKQQKFSKLSSLMNPELQALQKKYAGKRDNESMMKMQEETKAIYEKYGTSPTGSCLQLLITMPIMFALYYIVSNVPAYVPQVKSYYEDVSQTVVADYDYFNYMNDAYDDYVVGKKGDDKYSYIDDMLDSFTSPSNDTKVIDTLAKYKTSQWKDLKKSYTNAGEMLNELSKVTDDQWKKMIDSVDDKEEKADLQKFVDKITGENKESEIQKLSDEYKNKSKIINNQQKKIMKINEFGPLNLTQSPSSVMGLALLIPLLSYLTQWYSAKLAMSANAQQMAENPMGNSMKVMNVMLPLFTAFIAFSVPAGLGLYWVCNGVFQIIQQICINEYFKKVDVNDIIKKNVEKQNKKKEKQGIYANTVTNNASKSTKSIKSISNTNTKDITNTNVKYKSGSMASKANMVKQYNDKNRK